MSHAEFDVSVVIVSYNTRDLTLACVGSILSNVAGLKCEIIVVDNCSSDGTVQALRTRYPSLTVVASDHNGGFAYGNILGYGKSKGRYVLFLNPDTELVGDCLDRCIEHMERNPDVGILGCKVLFPDGTLQSTIFRYPTMRELGWRCLVPNSVMRNATSFGDVRYASKSRDESGDVDVVAGCFMLVPRRVIDEIGCMNAAFFMYSEETEWCYRASKSGYKIRYFPQAEVIHHGGASTTTLSEWKKLEIAKGQILYFRFTRDAFSAYIANLLMLTGSLIRLFHEGVRSIFNKSSREQLALCAKVVRFHIHAIFSPPKGQTTLADIP